MPPEPLPSEITKWLNLVRESPTFVLFEGQAASEMTIRSPAVIPAGAGLCWVGGALTTAGADTYDAVWVVDTDAGGELARGYVWDDGWIRLEDLAEHLGVGQRSVYPFEYALAVPLEVDHYH